jgi:hypothetical protein
MKSLPKYLAIVALFFISFFLNPTKSSAQGGAVSFQVFYDELSPYGQWVDYPGYGYVWIPEAGAGFSPYGSSGYWAYTDEGWAWVSDYNWGWAPFHYGRWDYASPYGWFWVPDYTWAPAWVAWRHGGGYYGWAPMRPGISVDIVVAGGYNPPNRRWCFVNDGYMGDRYIGRYYAPRRNNVTIINNATYVNNTYVDNSRHTTYMAGPRREDVQKSTGRPVKQMSISDRSTPGHSVSGNQINTYRPTVDKSSNKSARPTKVENLNNIQPVKQRNATYQQNHPNAQPQRNQQQPQSNPRTQQQQNQPRQQQQTQPRQQEQPRPQQQPRQQEQPRPQQQPRQQEQPRPQQQPRQQEQPRPQQQPRQQEQPRPQQQPRQQEQPRPQQQPRQEPGRR